MHEERVGCTDEGSTEIRDKVVKTTKEKIPKWGPQRETRQRARRSSMMFG